MEVLHGAARPVIAQESKRVTLAARGEPMRVLVLRGAISDERLKLLGGLFGEVISLVSRHEIETETQLGIVSDHGVGYRLELVIPARKRVLVIEDERGMRVGYAHLFESFDVELDFAETVKTGRTMLNWGRHAAYLIDLGMPDG